MSSKKKDKVLQQEVVEELDRLSGCEPSSPAKDSSLKNLFGDMMRQQAQQHSQMLQTLKSINDSSQSSCQAMVHAVQERVKSVPEKSPSPVPSDLYSPQDPITCEDQEEEASSDEEQDFEGWEFTPSGKVSDKEKEPTQETPSSPKACSSNTDKIIELDDGLFQAYNQMPNWKPAPEVINWLKAVCDKEVPPAATKEIFDSFMPPVDQQPLFNAPKLPIAITSRLFAAPKNIAKVPKMVNDHLSRAQKELAVAYKPFMELLSFYYTDQFKTLKECIPEIAPVLDSHKGLLSQGLALMVSAGIKISKARKDALRPIFKTPAVLRGAPTAAQVLGTEDLATLSEKTSKEQKALYGVFRPAYPSRTKFKFNRGGSRSFRGYSGYKNAKT